MGCGCNCGCSTDNKPQDAEKKPVDPKVEEAKELKKETIEAVEAGTYEEE